MSLVGIKNPCLFAGFSLPFSTKKNDKERKDRQGGPRERQDTVLGETPLFEAAAADSVEALSNPNLSEKVFVSQERVSDFPEKGADLRGSPGTSGEVWGTSGEVWETSGELLDCC